MRVLAGVHLAACMEGLGHVGTDGNLLTDAVQLPGTLLNGGDVGQQVGQIAGDIGHVVDGASGLVSIDCCSSGR